MRHRQTDREIGKLQRYAVEREKAHKMKILTAPAKKKADKVACVGSGLHHLHVLRSLHRLAIRLQFRSSRKSGGVLTYGITPARLPQHVVDFDIKSVKRFGRKIVFDTKVGRHHS